MGSVGCNGTSARHLNPAARMGLGTRKMTNGWAKDADDVDQCFATVWISVIGLQCVVSRDEVNAINLGPVEPVHWTFMTLSSIPKSLRPRMG